MNFLNHKIKTKRSRKAGFTLIEMLVAVFVFSVIMTIATGAIFSIVSANKTSQVLKSVLDNMSGAIDSMSRNIRYGKYYHCGTNSITSSSTPKSCANNGDASFSFVDRTGDFVIYDFRSKDEAVFKCTDSVSVPNCIRLTAPEVHIRDMHFYVQGAQPEDNDPGQPKLLMIIDGYAKAGSAQADFNLETMVNQRNLTCKNKVNNILYGTNCP